MRDTDRYHRVIDREPDLEQLVCDIAEGYGVDRGIAAVGVAWGRDWWEYLQGTRGDDPMAHGLLIAARDAALDGLPVPRDSTEGRPTFRARYCAERALVALAGDQGVDLRQLLDGKGHAIVPHFARIDEVLTTLLDSHNRRLFPYNLDTTRVPQDPRHMPRRPEFAKPIEQRTEDDKRKLANFWFCACYYMRGVNNSNDMTINLAALYEARPDIFDPHRAMAIQPREIELLLLEYHLPVQHEQISKFWVENARRLAERYDGDPRKIVEDFDRYDELTERVCNDSKGNGFLGFQKKMTSMLGYFLMANNLVPYQNIPLPVDFHVMRMSISTEMIRFPDIIEPRPIDFDRVTDLLRGVYYDFADHHGISQIQLCDVVWLYSRSACSRSPTNAQRIIGKRNARFTKFGSSLSRAEDATPEQIAAYRESCGHCRVAPVCVHNMPSRRYYIAGRVVYPDPKIHLTDDQPPLHGLDVSTTTQPSGSVATTQHKIDERAWNRGQQKRQRARIIRGLAAPALFGLDPDATQAIRTSMIQTDRAVDSSLTGGRFAFTRSEIVAALRREPTAEELDRLWPYLNHVSTLF